MVRSTDESSDLSGDVSPGHENVSLRRACAAVQVHLRQGRPAEAEATCRAILERSPDLLEILGTLGNLLRDQGRLREAEAVFRRAVAAHPRSPELHNNLGGVLLARREFAAAASAYARAIELRPDYANAHCNLAAALQQSDRLEEAEASARRAIELRPNLPEAHNTLGGILSARDLPNDAEPFFRRAIQLRPDWAEAHNNLGTALTALNRREEAAASFRRALALQPRYAKAWFNLGAALHEAGQTDQAIAYYRQALAIDPSDADTWNNLGNVLNAVGRTQDGIECFRRALGCRADARTASNVLFSLHLLPEMTRADLAREHAILRPVIVGDAPHVSRPGIDRDPGRRLRVGFVSPDFSEHPVGRFLLPLLSRRDRKGFEIVCWSDVRRPDAMTGRLRELSDRWHDTAGLSDARLAEKIAEDRIDILMDLALHTSGNRLPVFARRPAPLQGTFLAYAGAAGMPGVIDFRFSDAYLDPPELGDADSERIVRLRGTYWCFSAPPDAPPPEPRANGPTVFGCLNNHAKVSEPAFALWLRVLERVPDSRLLLHAPLGNRRAELSARAAAAGVDPARLEFVGRVPRHEYFRLYHRIDVALDPFPFAGGTTTCDALWMGVPVVSLAGQTGVSRAGLSILSNVGLPELVARDPEMYLRIAAGLAADSDMRARMRSGFRDRMLASPLMDAPAFARDLESAWRNLWIEWCKAERSS